MASIQLPFLRAWRRRVQASDRFAPLRFYVFYLRWPLLLALSALVGDKAIFYGALPLAAWTAREWSYEVAGRELAAGHDQAALFHIRQALLESREDARIWRRAAVISDRLDSPEAPYCWEQADRLEPGVPATELALAESAARHQEWEMTRLALHQLPPEEQTGVRFLVASGQLAAAEGLPAQSYFDQAEALHPGGTEVLFALADGFTSLATRDDEARARSILIALAGRGDDRVRALRKLLALEVHEGDLAAARKAERQLLASPGATFDDRVRELEVVTAPEIEPELQNLLAAASRENAPQVIDWMAVHGRAEAALIWIRSRDESWQEDPGVGVSRAHCLAALGEWTHLRDDQRDSLWPEHESTRLMLLAEASWQLGDESDAKSAWHRAVAACADLKDFTELADSAVTAPESSAFQTEVWLALANRIPGQEWPLRRLLHEELTVGDLVMAHQVANRLALLAPDDALINATRDLLCLLRGEDTARAAADLVRLDALTPGDPAVATAAAYALYLDGHFDDALATLGTLPPAELRAPERALYVGQLLAAAGPVDQAEAVLRVAQRKAGLPDEQKRALDRALTLISYRQAMAALLQAGDPAASEKARGFFLGRAPAGEPVFLIGAAMALMPDREAAAQMLARVDGTALDPVERELDEGAVLALAGPIPKGAPLLQLANGLPAETPLASWNRMVGAWWEMEDRGAFAPSITAGLLGAYRGLESAGPPVDFWRRDELREIRLARETLESGTLAAPVQARLEALLQHVPATPEIESEIGYALFLQGRVEAGRQRLEVLSEADRRRPEPARYYAAILQACGETKRAQSYALLASREAGPRKEL
jgi:tetratricopeptide (TPR) repeat protein